MTAPYEASAFARASDQELAFVAASRGGALRLSVSMLDQSAATIYGHPRRRQIDGNPRPRFGVRTHGFAQAGRNIRPVRIARRCNRHAAIPAVRSNSGTPHCPDTHRPSPMHCMSLIDKPCVVAMGQPELSAEALIAATWSILARCGVVKHGKPARRVMRVLARRVADHAHPAFLNLACFRVQLKYTRNRLISKSSRSVVPLQAPEITRTSARCVPIWATGNSKGTCLPPAQ